MIARLKELKGRGSGDAVTRLVETRVDGTKNVATTHRECAEVAARGLESIAKAAAQAETSESAQQMAELAKEITNGRDGEEDTGEWGIDMKERMGEIIQRQPQAHAEMLKMLNDVIGVEETTEVLKTLKSGKRVGSDKRANEGWKAAAEAEEFAELVSKMWNEVWDAAYQPSEWMKNLVGLLYKGKGPVEIFGNYRGLTFSQHIVKAYEEVLKRRMTKFMEALKLYPDAQYGGRRGRSPVHAIIMSALVLAGRSRTVIIVTDLAKAFPLRNGKRCWLGISKWGYVGRCCA